VESTRPRLPGSVVSASAPSRAPPARFV
jgi:hypothetical protein